jgi:hypothetical protein
MGKGCRALTDQWLWVAKPRFTQPLEKMGLNIAVDRCRGFR